MSTHELWRVSGSFLRPLTLRRKHKRKLFLFLSYMAPELALMFMWIVLVCLT